MGPSNHMSHQQRIAFFCGRNSKNGTEHYTVVHSQVAMTKTIHY